MNGAGFTPHGTSCQMRIHNKPCLGAGAYRVTLSNGSVHRLCPECAAAARAHHVDIARIEGVRP